MLNGYDQWICKDQHFQVTSLFLEQYGNGESCNVRRFQDCSFDGLEIENKVFSGTCFVNCRIFGCYFHDCLFEYDLFNKTFFHGVGFYDCEIVDLELSKVHILNCDFSTSEVKLGGAREITIEDTVFSSKPPYVIFGSKHPIYHLYPGEIMIGCLVRSIDDWLQTYKMTGTENGYELEEIEEYGRYVKMIAEAEKE